MEKMNLDLENVIILLCIVIVFLIGYSILYKKEKFEQIDICDYNSPDPSMFCKSIQKGCKALKYEFNDLNDKIKDKCTTLPTETKDIIDVAINCSDNTDRLIMNNYVQKEVCSQIKNFPEINTPSMIPEPDVLSPLTAYNASNEDYILNSKGYANF
jgi:hypothetical protein